MITKEINNAEHEYMNMSPLNYRACYGTGLLTLQLFKNSIDIQEELRLNLHSLSVNELLARIRAFVLNYFSICSVETDAKRAAIVKTKQFYKISRSFPIHAKYRSKNTRAPTDIRYLFVMFTSCLHRDTENYLYN